MIIMRKAEDPDPSLTMQFATANKTNTTLSPLMLILLLLGIFISTVSQADNSANFGLSSNYLWRGITQSNKNAAESGGFDYSRNSGFYLGTWASTLSEGSYEWDLYGGYSFSFNDINYDVGTISYRYPNSNDYFSEVYFNTQFAGFSAGVAYTYASKDNTSAAFSRGDLYYSVGYSYDADNGISLSTTIGRYDFNDELGDDYNHFNISASKSDFTLAIDTTNQLTNHNDTTLSLAWSKTFDL